jgi:hypothetical protein
MGMVLCYNPKEQVACKGDVTSFGIAVPNAA